jgi:predicted enzyme related to lactoylglutathione lyase
MRRQEDKLGRLRVTSGGSRSKVDRSSGSSGPSVFGLGGVFLRARDPESLYAWYEQHFGLARKDGCFVFAPDTGPGLTTVAFFPHDTDYFGPGNQQAMLNLRVADLDWTLQQLAAAGVTIDPRREDYDFGRFAWIIDPEGNRVELWQPA